MISKLTPETQGTMPKRLEAAEPSKHNHDRIVYPYEAAEVRTAMGEDMDRVSSEMESCAMEDDDYDETGMPPFAYRTRRMTTC